MLPFLQCKKGKVLSLFPFTHLYFVTSMESLVFNEWLPAGTIATNINRQLEEIGYKNLGVNARPNLVVLRRTDMPAVLVEVGFINNDQDNALLDAQFDATARAIADGIAGTLWTW
mgnify:CR=1 FL=1